MFHFYSGVRIKFFYKDELIEKWSKFNIPNTSDPIQFQKELDYLQRKEEELINKIHTIEDKMSLLSSEIS